MNRTIQTMINEVVKATQIEQLPVSLQKDWLHIFKHDLDVNKDWDDFIGGQKVAHTYYEKSIKAQVDLETLEFGNNPNTYYSLLSRNTTIEIYTTEYVDLNGKFVAIGGDLETKYLAISYKLHNFSNKKDKTEKLLQGKIILVDVVKYLSDQLDNEEGSIAPTINIANGKIGETITLPKIIIDKQKGIFDPNVEKLEEEEITIPKVASVELFNDMPAIHLGHDFIENESDNKIAPFNNKIEIKEASTRPTQFPINPEYCILPTQFKVPSIDNYGYTHPADTSNPAKVLSATQQLGSVAGSGSSLLGNLFGTITSGIANLGVSLGTQIFADKGTLANSSSIMSIMAENDSSSIKFFLQAGAIDTGIDFSASAKQIPEPRGVKVIEKEENGVKEKGLYVRFSDFSDDYLELNQSNGQFGKYGKSMSPENNHDYDFKNQYRGIGTGSLSKQENDILILMAAPHNENDPDEVLKTTSKKIQTNLKYGIPRYKIKNKDNNLNIGTPIQTGEWNVYMRNMFFRPDPYSFFNWPCIMPAEIGVHNLYRKTNIAYDTQPLADISAFFKDLGLENSQFNGTKTTDRMWSKTITIDMLAKNDHYDPNKTFSSFRYVFNEEKGSDFYQIHNDQFTSSVVQVKLLDKNGNVIREHKFNSQGKNMGTPASRISVFEI